MGFWDKAKEVGKETAEKAKQAKQDHDAKTAALKDERGKKLAAISYGLTYMGGYGDTKKAGGKLTFFENQTEFEAAFGKSKSFKIKNTEIVDVAIEGRHEVDKRVTVTRLLAVGIFAFAIKKKNEDKEAFVTIELKDGSEAIFHLTNRSPLEVKKKLSGAIGRVKQGKKQEASAQESGLSSIADELAKLNELKKQGIISQEEFESQKQKLLSK